MLAEAVKTTTSVLLTRAIGAPGLHPSRDGCLKTHRVAAEKPRQVLLLRRSANGLHQQSSELWSFWLQSPNITRLHR